MRTDANQIAMKAVRNILAGARPFEVEIANTRVACAVSPGESRAWPRELAGLSQEVDGPDWPPLVYVDCTWQGGRCKLYVECNYFSGDRYRHDISIKVAVVEPQVEVFWINVANEVRAADDGSIATLRGRFFLTNSAIRTDLRESLNAAMADVLDESKLPVISASQAHVCDIEVPGAAVLPSAEVVFRRLVQLALLKLDFIDPRANKRGKPLIDLARWGVTADQLVGAGLEEVAEDVLEDARDVRQYWAGGFKEKPRLEKFLAGNYWKIGWARDATGAAAKRTWKRFAQIQVGDWFAIKGYGGTHDLEIHYVGEVIEIKRDEGRLDLRRLDVPLYKGKGPNGAGSGNFHETIVPLARPDVIATIFGSAAGERPRTEPVAPPSSAITIPLNKIYYGPPGTGKTYKLTHELIAQFRHAPREADSHTELAEELKWVDATAIALFKLGGKAKVAALEQHPLIKAMHASGPMKAPLRQRLWGVLQSHTVEDSKTVAYKNRAGEELFDKREDSTWELVRPLPEELKEIAEQLAAPTGRSASDDFVFVTFHQAYGYEDFIEGIRPNIEQVADDGESALSYRLEDGAFMKAVRASLRLAGFEGSLHDFCGLSREERAAQFRDARHYAIFIDEINRGNVARIFGELITLIEVDKRLGAENEIIVQLPYSKKRFGVPPNLHVIGTMNTADRSIESLDAALRRRFEFEELSPRPEALEFTIEGDIDPEEMLRAINRRIEKLYDRDHCLGHAYLLEIEDDPTLENLKRVFRTKLIPLLQEYFFGDWGKIGLVLGKDFVVRRDTSGTQFADFDHDDRDALAERPTWHIEDLARLSNLSFQRIYKHVADD